jgi:hypothetical protein
MGAHLVKVGCSSIVCDMIARGFVSAVAMNGATAIHDVEVAMTGRTSEDVAETIHDGSFGTVKETPAFFADAIRKRTTPDQGLGDALGRHIRRTRQPNARYSILATAHRVGIPATVHVAIGTDTIHMHSEVSESEIASMSTVDFRLVCSVVGDLAAASRAKPAGVWCNIGSAVIMPEVFLKAIAVARNLGADLDRITTANLDMIRHYRPSENVIGRPIRGGKGLQLIGHHEIMLPLLRQAVLELS